MTITRERRFPTTIALALLLPIVVLICSAPLYVAAGITFEWPSLLAQVMLPASFGLGAIVARRDTNGVPQTLMAIAVLVTVWLVFGPLQYLAAAWNRPLIDHWLLRQDEVFGLSRPAIDSWLVAHSTIRHLLGLAYISFLPQFILVPVVLGWVDRVRLWRFVCQFQLVALFTVVAFGLFPAGTPALHGVHEWLSQASAMQQLFGVRSGELRVVDVASATGLISWPSFHVAGALLVVWALRGTWLFWPMLCVDALLMTSTVLLGVHYLADVYGAMGLTAAVVWATEVCRTRQTLSIAVSYADGQTGRNENDGRKDSNVAR